MRSRPAALLLAAALLAACDRGPSGPRDPEPGTLRVTYETGAADDGAILLSLTGPGIGEVAAAAPAEHRVLLRDAGSGVRAAVFGPLRGGDVLTLAVPDVHRARDYRATLLQVSDDDGRLRSSLSGRALRVRR